MCGIVGYISTGEAAYVKEKAHFLRYALAIDTLRGHDSTGIMTVKDKFTVKTLRTLMPGDAFIHTKDFKKKIEYGWALFGHNRAATHGEISIDNAHLFMTGDITLMHNGTLYQGGKTLDTYDASHAVDSMQIAVALAARPPEKAAEVASKIDGSFAVVWFDRRDDSINIMRNGDRPLHFGYNSAKTIVWFMSDGHHLYPINKSFRTSNAEANSIYLLDKNKILKWKKGDLVPEVTPFDPFAVPVTASGNMSGPIADGVSNALNPKLVAASTRWSEHMRKTNSDNLIPIKPEFTTQINGRRAAIPAAHLKTLHKEFQMTPADVLELEPIDVYDLGEHKVMVTGTVNIPHWGDCPWPAILYNATHAEAMAYKKQNWLVRPIGVGMPCLDHEGYDSSILCSIIHYKWADYKRALKEKTDDRQPTPDYSMQNEKDIEIKGPGNRYFPVKELRKKCENGCVQCGGIIPLEEVTDCIIVNEGRDLMCEQCQNELTNPYMLPSPSSMN